MDQHTDSPFTTTHEHLRFDDGSHVIVHSSPGRVQVTGYVAGEWIEYAGTARDAEEQARLLEIEAPDALWTMPREQSHRIALAMAGAVGAADYHDGEVPEADSPEDLGGAEVRTPASSERVALDGGHADLEVIDQHVEVTVTIDGKVTIGLALSPAEASRIGEALRTAAHRAHVVQAAQIDLEGVRTVTDLLRRSRDTGVPVSALVEGIDR